MLCPLLDIICDQTVTIASWPFSWRRHQLPMSLRPASSACPPRSASLHLQWLHFLAAQSHEPGAQMLIYHIGFVSMEPNIFCSTMRRNAQIQNFLENAVFPTSRNLSFFSEFFKVTFAEGCSTRSPGVQKKNPRPHLVSNAHFVMK